MVISASREAVHECRRRSTYPSLLVYYVCDVPLALPVAFTTTAFPGTYQVRTAVTTIVTTRMLNDRGECSTVPRFVVSILVNLR